MTHAAGSEVYRPEGQIVYSFITGKIVAFTTCKNIKYLKTKFWFSGFNIEAGQIMQWKLSLYKTGLVLLIFYNILKFLSESNLDYYDHFKVVFILQSVMVVILLFILIKGWITNKKRDFLFGLISLAFLAMAVYFVLQLFPSAIAIFEL
jgi:hypothetical protein